MTPQEQLDSLDGQIVTLEKEVSQSSDLWGGAIQAKCLRPTRLKLEKQRLLAGVVQ
jgi:hypothetical protein